MKRRNIIKYSLVCLLTVGAIMALSGVGRVNAVPYGSPGPNEAVFNIYKDVPYGIGDESDFVRLRQSTGAPTIPAVENGFIDPLNAACEADDRFDIRTYIHNGALADKNEDGNGPAVAHDVALNMIAPLGQANSSFSFQSTISSSNTPSVTDTGTLNCEDTIKLKLVPQSVHVYSVHYGWQNATDAAINGVMPVGSQEFGASEVWGCWEQRVVVVYQVEVVDIPKEQPEEPEEPVQPEEPVVTPAPQPQQPTVLPATGAGSMLGLFAGTSAIGTIGYRIVLARRGE